MKPTMMVLFAALALPACVGEAPTNDDAGDADGADGDTSDGDGPPVCEATRSYVGFDGGPLERDRVALAAGADRLRMKPFAALAAEYSRTLGLADFDTSEYAATFGKPPARWYQEPAASASTLYGAFALAYAACTAHVASDAATTAAPTAATADAYCRTKIRQAWARDASDAEAATCADYALTGTATAPTPRARWAYTCASVLGAAGFLAY